MSLNKPTSYALSSKLGLKTMLLSPALPTFIPFIIKYLKSESLTIGDSQSKATWPPDPRMLLTNH